MQSFRNLEIWQLSKELCKEIYKATEDFPKAEIFGLVNQLRRAACSVPANIAEGSGRNTSKDFANFISISIGSLSEIESHLEISKELFFIDEEKYTMLMKQIEEIRRKSINFSKRLKGITS